MIEDVRDKEVVVTSAGSEPTKDQSPGWQACILAVATTAAASGSSNSSNNRSERQQQQIGWQTMFDLAIVFEPGTIECSGAPGENITLHPRGLQNGVLLLQDLRYNFDLFLAQSSQHLIMYPYQ